MSQHRRCPNCEIVIPIGQGIIFDSKNNAICASCNRPVVAVSSDFEGKIKAHFVIYNPRHQTSTLPAFRPEVKKKSGQASQRQPIGSHGPYGWGQSESIWDYHPQNQLAKGHHKQLIDAVVKGSDEELDVVD